MEVTKALYHIGYEPIVNIKSTLTKERYLRLHKFLKSNKLHDKVKAYDMFSGTSDEGHPMYLMQLQFTDREEILNVTIREHEMRARQ